MSGGVQSVTTNARDVVGRGGTIIKGNAPSCYIGGGSAFVATISRGFRHGHPGRGGAPRHRVHGMGLAMEAPTWPAITPEEATACWRIIRGAARIEALRWHSPRPFPPQR
jgi:hypothetical protein